MGQGILRAQGRNARTMQHNRGLHGGPEPPSVSGGALAVGQPPGQGAAADPSAGGHSPSPAWRTLRDVCVCVFMCECLWVCACECVCVCMWAVLVWGVPMCVCVHLSVCMCACVCVCI